MTNIVIAYYSATGNTEAMANEIARGAKDAGGEVTLTNISDISPDEVLSYDVIALGCASYGNEVLEEYEFQPFFDDLKPGLSGKKVALFGSYDWGNGEWMESWVQEVLQEGADVVNDEGLIANLYPDESALEKCYELGQKLAE